MDGGDGNADNDVLFEQHHITAVLIAVRGRQAYVAI